VASAFNERANSNSTSTRTASDATSASARSAAPGDAVPSAQRAPGPDQAVAENTLLAQALAVASTTATSAAPAAAISAAVAAGAAGADAASANPTGDDGGGTDEAAGEPITSDDTAEGEPAAFDSAPTTGPAAATSPAGTSASVTAIIRKAAAPLTIYDVARHAGVSIASVSRVLNGHDTPRAETRERVRRAVAELGFVPDGAARALSSRLKEIIAVVYRRAPIEPTDDPVFEDEADNLAFVDVINRGIEANAQRRGYDLLLSSVAVHDHAPGARIAALAGKSDGMLLHDRVLTPSGIVRLADRVPVVTLAGTPTRASVNVSGDNATGMRDLITHLIEGHGCRSIAYISGHADSPDSVVRARVVRETAARYGVTVADGAEWAGTYSAIGGARVIRSLLDGGGTLPDAIACANDQTALGVLYALREHGYRIPEDVLVTGFDDIPVARHLNPPLTTVRQPIHELGALAFDVLLSMINAKRPAERQLTLPVQMVLRGSCGCPMDPPSARFAAPAPFPAPMPAPTPAPAPTSPRAQEG
jgi:LacI family transcriptional regulator, galactose operon repressor